MSNKKKVILNACLFAAIFFLTIFAVFRNQNLSEILEDLQKCNFYWLIPAIACVVIFISGEATILWDLFHSYGISVGPGSCFLFSSIGFFFSCVTPSSTGGQPMQVVFMRKKKIPVPTATVVLMVVTIVYKLILVLVGIAIPIFTNGFLDRYMGDVKFLFYLGLFLNIVFVTALCVVVFHPSLARTIAFHLVHLLMRIHILKSDRIVQNLDAHMAQYMQTADFIKEHWFLMLRVLVITLIQRMSMFAVTYFVYRSFSLHGTAWMKILILQAVISVCVDMLPMPGGMGVSEALFFVLFDEVFGADLILPGLVLSRGLGYYSELLISAVFTAIAVIYFNKKSFKSFISARKQRH